MKYSPDQQLTHCCLLWAHSSLQKVSYNATNSLRCLDEAMLDIQCLLTSADTTAFRKLLSLLKPSAPLALQHCKTKWPPSFSINVQPCMNYNNNTNDTIGLLPHFAKYIYETYNFKENRDSLGLAGKPSVMLKPTQCDTLSIQLWLTHPVSLFHMHVCRKPWLFVCCVKKGFDSPSEMRNTITQMKQSESWLMWGERPPSHLLTFHCQCFTRW